MRELNLGSNMNCIFIITISGLERVPRVTQTFLDEAEKVTQIRHVGINLWNKGKEFLEKKYDLSLAEFITGGEISSGEIGCLLSHQEAYGIICKENIDWALIFEDDAEILINTHELISMSENWFNSGYEYVHLSPYLGGVVINQRADKTGKALVPPLSAYAYWISGEGARKLRTRNSTIGGLADWPIQVANLQIRSLFEPIAYSGLENSIIGSTQTKFAQLRISLSYRPLKEIITYENLKFIKLTISTYGLKGTLKFIFSYRLYKRIAKILKFSQENSAQTYFL
jgi:hypothetical protein